MRLHTLMPPRRVDGECLKMACGQCFWRQPALAATGATLLAQGEVAMAGLVGTAIFALFS